MDAVELEGREAFFIHGTILDNIFVNSIGYGGKENTYTFEKFSNGQNKYIVNNLTPVLGNKISTSNVDFEWDGDNSDEARQPNWRSFILNSGAPTGARL